MNVAGITGGPADAVMLTLAGLSQDEHPNRDNLIRSDEMSSEQVDRYLRALDEPKRSTLEALRRTILEVVPEAEQVISYGVPAFRLRGQTVAGLAAFKSHLSYLPFSGSVLGRLAADLEGYEMTKSSLHFPVDRPLPKTLVQKLIDLRLAEGAQRSRS